MASSVKTRVINMLVCDAGLCVCELEKESNVDSLCKKILKVVFE